MLDGRDSGPKRDIIALNAGAVLYVAGRAPSIREGAAEAGAVIQRGAARATLERLVAFGKTAP